MLFGNGLLGVVDGLCGGLLTEGFQISRLVCDICYVYVYEPEADLFQLDLNVVGDSDKELVAVGVYLLDVHCGDYQTELTEDYILCELLYLDELEAQQALGGVLHDPRLCGDADGEP